MKRVLLSLMVIGAIFYPAYTYFAANDQTRSDGRSAILRQVPALASPGVEGIDEAQAAEEPGGADAMRITGKGIWGPPEDRTEALRTLKRVPELGIDFVDTADSYGPDVSEQDPRGALSL